MLVDKWDLEVCDKIRSNSEISKIEPFLTGAVYLLTINKKGSICNYNDDRVMAFLNIDRNVLKINYNPENKCLAFLHSTGIYSIVLSNNFDRTNNQEFAIPTLETRKTFAFTHRFAYSDFEPNVIIFDQSNYPT